MLSCQRSAVAYGAIVNEARPNRPILALILRLFAALSVTVMMAVAKYAHETGVHLAEIIFWRQMPTAPVLLLWFAFNGGIGRLATRRIGAQAARALVGLVSMSCYFSAVSILPLAEATTITFSAAIWAVILSSVLLKEKVGIYRWSAVILGFVGVLIITQPGTGHIPLLGAGLALTAACLISLISIQIRDLARTDEPLTIVFYFSVFSVPPLALILPFVHHSLSIEQWGLMAALGALGLLSQFLLTAALRFGVVASVMVMDYSALIWAILIGWGAFGDLPPAATWLGAPLVVGAGLVVAWREHHLAKRPSATPVEAEGTAS